MAGAFQASAFQNNAFQVDGVTARLVSSGGGSSLTFDEWLARHPWVRGLEIRPNWYAYPKQKKKVKAQILKAAREKKSVEQKMSFAKSSGDLTRLLATLNVMQERLAALREMYREGMAAYQTDIAREAEEEAEFMELLTEIL